ncbi:MAG: hypothetical protein JEY99_03990 [Spirochaetales bacterium]|nr:hypothetical protein [Spirochaetales bacterium]
MIKNRYIILAFLILSSFIFMLSAQENEVIEKSGSSAVSVRGLTPALEIEANTFGFAPNFTFFMDLGFNLGPRIIISPRVGFTYFLDVWDEIHDDMYIPVGVRISLPFYTFAELLYYFPIEFDYNRIRLRFSAGGEAFLYNGSSTALSLTAAMGTGIFLFTDTNRVLFPFSFKLGFRFYF